MWSIYAECNNSPTNAENIDNILDESRIRPTERNVFPKTAAEEPILAPSNFRKYCVQVNTPPLTTNTHSLIE